MGKCSPRGSANRYLRSIRGRLIREFGRRLIDYFDYI
jgi:hypothetical protein